MAASLEAICNLALSHLGIAKTVTVLATDATPESIACNQFMEQVIDEVLRDFPWPFATSYATLLLVEEDPTVEWDYSYRLPSDCRFVRRIVQDDSSRNETRQSRAPFRIVRDADSTEYSAATTYAIGDYAKITTGVTIVWYVCIQAGTAQNPATATTYWTVMTGVPPQLLLTDRVDCEIEYTVDVTDPREFPPDFVQAVAAKLAFYTAPRLAQDETGKTGERPMALYVWLLSRAKANAANEEAPDDPQPSEFERSRTL